MAEQHAQIAFDVQNANVYTNISANLLGCIWRWRSNKSEALMSEINRERNEIDRELNQFNSGEQQLRIQLDNAKKDCSYSIS